MDNQPTVAPATGPTPLEPIKTWPGAFGIYKYSREVMRLCLGTVVMLWVINFIVQSLASGITGDVHGTSALRFIGQIISLAVASLTSVASIYAIVSAIRGQRVKLNDALDAGWPLIIKAFVLNLLVGITVVVSFLLLIVPGLFVLPRLALATYFLVDQKMSIMDSYTASWRATKGHAAKVWGIIGVSFLMVLPVITIVGIIATVYWLVMYAAATALLYVYIKDHPTAPATT